MTDAHTKSAGTVPALIHKKMNSGCFIEKRREIVEKQKRFDRCFTSQFCLGVLAVVLGNYAAACIGATDNSTWPKASVQVAFNKDISDFSSIRSVDFVRSVFWIF